MKQAVHENQPHFVHTLVSARIEAGLCSREPTSQMSVTVQFVSCIVT